MQQQFSSDNLAGICPTAWEAMAEARTGHAQPCGVIIYRIKIE